MEKLQQQLRLSLFLRRFYLIKWSLREDNWLKVILKSSMVYIADTDLSVKVYQNKWYFAIEILHLKHYL